MAKTGSKLTDKTDLELVAMASCGSSEEREAAFFTLYARYRAGVCAHISKYVRESEDIEDICMESFEKAFKQIRTYNRDNKMSTWLYRIARNTAFDHLDKEKVRGKKIDKMPLDTGDPEPAMDVPSDSVSPEEEFINSQDHENFLSCLEGLPSLYRDVAKMNLVENLGYKEISEQTELPINTVKTRISRAKALIVRMMLDMEE